MQDARNEKIDLQPTLCLEYITRKLADCPAMKGWAIVKVGPEQLPKINHYLKSPRVVSWLHDTGCVDASGINLL